MAECVSLLSCRADALASGYAAGAGDERAWQLGEFFLQTRFRRRRISKKRTCCMFIIYRMSRPRADSTSCRSSKKTMLSNENRPERPGYYTTESCQCHNPMSMVHYLQSNDSFVFLG